VTRQAVVVVAVVALAALAACTTNPTGGPKGAAPNVDFYLMLDTSPSMELAATSDGIASLKAATQPNEGGCEFGCHQSHPADLGAFRTAGGGHQLHGERDLRGWRHVRYQLQVSHDRSGQL